MTRVEGVEHDTHIWLDEANRILDSIRAIVDDGPDQSLAAHDAEVATTERERIATVIAEDAETWEATADRLQLEKEYADSNRYYNYAAARRNVAAMLRNGADGPGTPEPSAAEYRKTEPETTE